MLVVQSDEVCAESARNSPLWLTWYVKGEEGRGGLESSTNRGSEQPTFKTGADCFTERKGECYAYCTLESAV